MLAYSLILITQQHSHNGSCPTGLSFSVIPGVKIPPSLVNIYKELTTDIAGFMAPNHGYLNNWAKQGVLLLNACLTVREGEANAHAKER
ncbi:hypothetical protein SARC_11187 [Sphaeroforma arctica JP610]|uniref:Uracil-DNA glycosylase-like domain-containing protein n=1 Tax=Sphaeroforma arctica JP610 TaxID=667725 RepID=A0A0L0FHP8_9EUKA|nr:hypothetical protein SARC_11187 [Sphaeroforma arctica JP610]KNC76304.1 hypothetical protein SARC_11187 [Sphaeroforma arctica JP610]|eukprot:XP_014150206.1 hypothetical protein SARC_11187 [Sphaeroforma arctica JP610]